MKSPIPAPRETVEREGELPAVTALRAFVTAAQLRSFSRAADELDITQSGVSRAVRSIEDMSGRQLFERTGSGLVLTEPGTIFYDEVTSILSELGAATLRLSTYGEGADQLAIATLPSLGGLWLAPRIGRFVAANPAVEVSVAAQIGHFDFEGTHFDCAIHYGNETWAGCLSEMLMDEVLVPFCAPGLLPRGTTPHLRLLLELPLIQHLHRPTAWREWFRELGIEHPSATRGIKFEQYQMGIEAAKTGLGAILMPPFMVTEEMESGQLVAWHNLPVPTPWRYYLVYPKAKRSKPSVQKFRSWIRTEARRTLQQTARMMG